MTSIHNTTDIKDSIIEEIVRIVIPSDTPPVNSITIRNKQENKRHGNWGYFIPSDYRITLNVPRFTRGMVIEGQRHTTKLPLRFDNNLDFLATVIGHEYYHAWQWNHERELWHCREYMEVEAEKYEIIALNKWKDHMTNLGVYALVAKRG